MNTFLRTNIKSIFLGAILLTATIHTSCAQSKAEKLDKLLEAYAEYGKFNGSILVADKGEVIYKKGFGLANVEHNIPNQTYTKFRLASISKQFTAMLIVQLAAENKLKLDVPITTYLPDYPKKNGELITIHQLLCHSSGIPNYTDFSNFHDLQRDPHRPMDIVKLFADSTLEFTPGTKFSYSNSGYILLGALIEKITGKTYETVLQEKIFSPLKMYNSGYDHNSSIEKNRASGYDRAGNNFKNTSYIDMSFPFSAGALYSTVEDMYLWDQALYAEKLLPKKYMDMLFVAHMPASGSAYGYGWEIGTVRVGSTEERLASVAHSGGINGFNTQITRIPSDKSLIVILNNAGGAPLREMTTAINGILHDKPYKFPKRSVANELSNVIEKNGLNKGLEFYKVVKDSAGYRLDEGEMNMLGYQFLGSNKAKEAAAVFKLNVEAFPKSYNTYDSYGEALLALGEKTLAIENYKKSVQMNPGSASGIKVLKELNAYSDTMIKKIPIERLKLLEGEYIESKAPGEWKIVFQVVNGELTGNDRGYNYRLIPVGEDKFINPDDGASLVFNTKDKTSITLMLFEKVEFKKMK